MSKYRSKTLAFEGEKFDSQKEFRRWQELRLLERAGKIEGLRRQVRFELVPPQYETVPRYSDKTGKRLKDAQKVVEHGVCYIADFVYRWVDDGATVVEDSKGVKTEAYIIKRKLMLHIHGIKIFET